MELGTPLQKGPESPNRVLAWLCRYPSPTPPTKHTQPSLSPSGRGGEGLELWPRQMGPGRRPSSLLALLSTTAVCEVSQVLSPAFGDRNSTSCYSHATLWYVMSCLLSYTIHLLVVPMCVCNVLYSVMRCSVTLCYVML